MCIGHIHSGFQKRKFARQKQNFCNADSDADAEISKWPRRVIWATDLSAPGPQHSCYADVNSISAKFKQVN